MKQIKCKLIESAKEQTSNDQVHQRLAGTVRKHLLQVITKSQIGISNAFAAVVHEYDVGMPRSNVALVRSIENDSCG
jgi:hypothetical protein